MIVWDPIYGRFDTPSFLERLILAPEVRRLRDVRLLNTPSPSLPTLSEIRRYSHTLGVLHLALTNPHIGVQKEELRALAASILIHDAATPPLAHLLEYYLRDRTGWDHESALPQLLTGHHVIENVAHQILPGEELKFKRLCASSGIDFEIVLQIVRKQHPISVLLFGTLDFDNLDNVLRMAWALGLPTPADPILMIAREIACSLDGGLVLSAQLRGAVEQWASVRQKVYEVLVYDELTVASQAVLMKAMRLLFDQKQAIDINWARRDGDIIELLSTAPETKELMIRHFHEALPRELVSIRLEGSLSDMGFPTRDHAVEFIERFAREEFGVKKPFGYAFVDRGTFSKQLEFTDPTNRKKWTYGTSSRSVILYCFAQERSKGGAAKKEAFRRGILKSLGVADSNVDDARKSARFTG